MQTQNQKDIVDKLMSALTEAEYQYRNLAVDACRTNSIEAVTEFVLTSRKLGAQCRRLHDRYYK